MVPFDVQLIGGMVLHEGKIAEMRTGEGKTLVATMPLYLNALAGKGAHLVTVNDYLARARPRVDGAGVRVARADRRLHPAGDGPVRAQAALQRRHHLRHEQRVRVRLPARQHGGAGSRTRSSAATTTPSWTRSTRSSSTRRGRRSSSPGAVESEDKGFDRMTPLVRRLFGQQNLLVNRVVEDGEKLLGRWQGGRGRRSSS